MYYEFLDPSEEAEPENYGDDWKDPDDICCSMCGSDDLEPTFIDEDGTETYQCLNCGYADNEFYPNDAAA